MRDVCIVQRASGDVERRAISDALPPEALSAGLASVSSGYLDPCSVAAAGEVVNRCAPPHTELWCVPGQIAGSGGWHYEGYCVSTPERAVILVRCGDVVGALETVHHEVWHSVEPWLLPNALSAVDEMAARGRVVPGDYLSDPAERRARLYQAVARGWDEGLRVQIGREDRAIAVMWSVYSGVAAAEVQAALAKASRPPSVWRRAWDAVFS